MISLIVGSALIAVILVEALWTTLWVNGGGGPLSSWLAAGLWMALRKATSQGRAWPLSVAGPVIIVVVVLSWVGLLWAGWTLVFAADPAALSYRDSGEFPDWTGRIYFVGYTLFTLGIGNIVPARGAWEIITVVASGTGMLFITLSISYMVSVLGAIVVGRAFANSVRGLGDDAEDAVRRAWEGERYTGLTLPLSTLTSQLATITQQHLTYPILHFYRARDADAAPTLAVAMLDEVLTVLRFGVPPSCRPPATILEAARSSVQSYLEALKDAHVEPAERPPRPPALGRLRAMGLPTVSDDAFAEALAALAQRRRTLLGMVEADARTWPPEQP